LVLLERRERGDGSGPAVSGAAIEKCGIAVGELKLEAG
jgi:hypothetical protein